MLKKIEAVLRPYKIQEIIDALKSLDVVFYIEDCKGYGKRLSPLELYKNKQNLSIESLPRTKVTLVVSAEREAEVLNLIVSKGSTGIVGDGKIFVEPVLQMIDMETREIYE